MERADKNDCMTIKEAFRRGDIVHIDLWYPRVDGNPSYLQIGLMDTRAADDLRISYDFVRDGWSVEQASTFRWDVDDDECDPDWEEVAFIEAWGRRDESRAP